MSPAESLAAYRRRSPHSKPIHVARDHAGQVLAWSLCRRDVARRAPEGSTIARESAL